MFYGLFIHVEYVCKYILGQVFQKCLARVNQNAEILLFFSRVGIIVTYVYSQTAKLYSSTYTSVLLNMKRPISYIPTITIPNKPGINYLLCKNNDKIIFIIMFYFLLTVRYYL